MGSFAKTYQSEVYDNFGLYATWFPGDRIEVGDIGIFMDGVFRRETSLRELQIACEVEELKGAKDIQLTSKEGVKIEAGGKADAAANAKLGLSIKFSGSGAFLLQASGLVQQRLSNGLNVSENVLAAHARGTWKKDWVLVDAIHTARMATVIVSDDKSAEMMLSADADTSALYASLANVDANLSVAFTTGKLFQMLKAKDLTPFYTCRRIKKSWFDAPQLSAVRGHADAANLFERPAIGELTGP